MMAEPSQKPLLTFAVAGFNQERFVQEAVEAAFAQTYSPLEIVLSDDCSQDRTFDIMRQMAAAYRGPHRLVLNRNPIRRSIGGHVNRIMEISHGDLIIAAAGDDVSLPQRTQVVYEVWQRSERKTHSIHSDVIQIDESGQRIEQLYASTRHSGQEPVIQQSVKPSAYVENFQPVIFGCAHAWSRQIFSVFGDLPDEVIHEDNVLPFRSLLLAEQLIYIKEPLVKYRLHGQNVFLKSRARKVDLSSLEGEEDRLWRGCKNRVVTYGTFLADLQTAKLRGLIGSDEFERTANETVRLRQRYSLMGEFLESGLSGKCRILSRLRREGLKKGEAKLLVPRLVPRPLLLRIRLARSYAALAWSRSA